MDTIIFNYWLVVKLNWSKKKSIVIFRVKIEFAETIHERKSLWTLKRIS